VQLQYAIRRKCMFDITNLEQHHMNLFLLISKKKQNKTYNHKTNLIQQKNENMSTQKSKNKKHIQTNKQKKKRKKIF